MQSDLTALIERVESGDGPDFELERDIGLAIGTWEWVSAGGARMLRCDGEVFPDHEGALFPSLLQSLDAVLSLIETKLPGWGYDITYRSAWGNCCASVCANDKHAVFYRGEVATGKNAARALLSAALRAIQETRNDR